RYAVGYASSSAGAPVSSSDFRLERTLGQPPETAVMNFEGSRSMVWVIDSLTAPALGSSSIVQSESPSASSSGLLVFRHRSPGRRGGSAPPIWPASRTGPPAAPFFHDEPAVHWLSP